MEILVGLSDLAFEGWIGNRQIGKNLGRPHDLIFRQRMIAHAARKEVRHALIVTSLINTFRAVFLAYFPDLTLSASPLVLQWIGANGILIEPCRRPTSISLPASALGAPQRFTVGRPAAIVRPIVESLARWNGRSARGSAAAEKDIEISAGTIVFSRGLRSAAQ